MIVFSDSWLKVHEDFNCCLVKQGYHIENASMAFELVMITANNLSYQDPDKFLVRDCLRFMAHQNDSNCHRVIYFPTRPGQVPEFMFRLLFFIFFGRLNGWNSAIAWISFPIGLISPELYKSIREFISTANVVVKKKSIRTPEICIVSDKSITESSTLYIGSHPPTQWKHIRRTGVANAYGYPLVCIPSRSVSEISMSEAPWNI